MDFIKLILPPWCTTRILNNPNLELFTKVSRSTGEITEYHEAKKNGITVRVINKVTTIYFSAHKLYNLHCNDINNNSGDFGYIQFLWVLSYIEELFKIPLDQFKVENIEFGLNFRPETTQQAKLVKHPVIHRGDHFREMFNQRGQCIGHECVHQQYHLKLYYKSMQLGNGDNEYRFEIKVKRMQFLGAILAPSRIHEKVSHVLTLNDLKKNHVWAYLKKELLRVFGEILFYESIENFKNLSSSNIEFVLKVTNPRYWAEKQLAGDEYTNAWRKYHRLVRKHCVHNPKEELVKLLDGKLNELTQLPRRMKELDSFTSFNPSIGRSNTGGSRGIFPSAPP